MPPSFTSTNAAVSVAPADLIQDALYELGVLSAGDSLSSDDSTWCLSKLQRLIDTLNAAREIVFSKTFTVYALIANHAPHTIGPGGDFNTPLRPVRIETAAFILNSGTTSPVDVPIYVRDDKWWAANPLKSQTNSIVRYLYYDPAQPLGNLNFWPICNISNPVRLEAWNSLVQAIDLSTQLGFAPGYWDLIVQNLAVALGPSYTKEPSPTLAKSASESLRRVMENNNKPPQISVSGGMPGVRPTGIPDFDFLTGLNDNW